jgi:hypothetical protein
LTLSQGGSKMYGLPASRDTGQKKCMDRPHQKLALRHGKSRHGKSRFQASQKKVNVWAGRVSRPTETREIETWEIAISGVSKKSKCMGRPRLKWGLETRSVHTFFLIEFPVSQWVPRRGRPIHLLFFETPEIAISRVSIYRVSVGS